MSNYWKCKQLEVIAFSALISAQKLKKPQLIRISFYLLVYFFLCCWYTSIDNWYNSLISSSLVGILSVGVGILWYPVYTNIISPYCCDKLISLYVIYEINTLTIILLLNYSICFKLYFVLIVL